MNGRQQRPQRKTLQWQLALEQEQQSSTHRPSADSVQPDAKSNNPQEDLQTQDWVCEPPQSSYPGSRWNVSIDERRRLAMLHVQNRTNTARDSSKNTLEMYPPGLPLTEPAPTSSIQVPENMVGPPQDIVQMVAELVYESVDRDVLLPYPLHSTIYANAFQDFLARNIHLWQNENFEAQTSRSPPS